MASSQWYLSEGISVDIWISTDFLAVAPQQRSIDIFLFENL
jgi:hypothetical protein